MYILVVTSCNGDLHVESVINYIPDNFVPLIIDTEYFGIDWFVSLIYENIEESYIVVHDKKIFVNKIHSVWWRKPTPVNIKYMKNELASFVFRETNDTIYGLIWILDALGKLIINHPFYNYKASIKPLQLLIARKIGLLVPDTAITNDYEFAKTKIINYDCISKGVSMSWAIIDDKNHGIFVKKIDSEKTEKISLIKKCPATIQQLVFKEFYARIIVILDKVFYFRIEDFSNNIDWRKSLESNNLKYSYIETNKEFCFILKSYNDNLNLNFSVFDFILDKDNNLQFLESNPNGQWLWLDEYSDFEISKYFAEVLTT